MTHSPWTQRCPLGHTGLRGRANVDHYECVACEAYYSGDPEDIREVEGFPRPSEEYEIVGTYGEKDQDQDRDQDQHQHQHQHQHRPSSLQAQPHSQGVDD